MEQVVANKTRKRILLGIIIGLLTLAIVGTSVSLAGYAKSQQVKDGTNSALQIGAEGSAE